MPLSCLKNRHTADFLDKTLVNNVIFPMRFGCLKELAVTLLM